MVKDAFVKRGFAPVTVDTPFSASGPHTVSAAVARTCAIPAIQVEMNSRLLMEDDPRERFPAVLDALRDIRRALDRPAPGM